MLYLLLYLHLLLYYILGVPGTSLDQVNAWNGGVFWFDYYVNIYILFTCSVTRTYLQTTVDFLLTLMQVHIVVQTTVSLSKARTIECGCSTSLMKIYHGKCMVYHGVLKQVNHIVNHGKPYSKSW